MRSPLARCGRAIGYRSPEVRGLLPHTYGIAVGVCILLCYGWGAGAGVQYFIPVPIRRHRIAVGATCSSVAATFTLVAGRTVMLVGLWMLVRASMP